MNSALILTWIFLGCQPPGILGAQTLPRKGRRRVGLEQGKILIVESEQFVSATFPSDLHKGKKRKKFLTTLRS